MMRSLVVRRFLAATVIATTGLVSVAGEAFESVAAPRTHTMPGLSEPFSSMPFAPGITPPPDDASLDGVRYRYIVSNAYLGALGPNAATEDFQAYPGIYECPDDAFIPDGEKVRVDMNQCRLATAWHLEPFRMKSIRDAEIADGKDQGSYLPPGARLPLDADLPAYDAQPTWLPTHQAWNHWEPAEGKDFHAEHTEIAEVAAEAAGLLAQTTIFERFFLRYPTANRVVASAQKGGQGGSRYTIGQSFTPTGHVARTGGTFEAPSALATRGVSLLELVQLPDFSHSLMDWANGNEACPPSIGTAIGGMYRDQNPIHSCHEFSRVMGSMNASHFYPLAKSFYEHYHALAKARMSECPEAEPAAQIDEYFWPDDDILHSFGVDMGISPRHTPGHVCEREAMAYEMIAQHFLQDGWSTGHMWHRWGYPEIDKFNFALPGENPAHIPAATQRPRRAAVAMLTAMAAGQIHGARSVIDRQIRDYFDRETAERILATGITDDPLSAPRLTDFQLTSWISGASAETGVPAVFPGAGDLYWDPFVPTDPDDPDAEKLQVRWAPTYDRQRTQMIACAATSMLEVYKAGSQIHGELAEGPILYNPLHGGDPVLLLGGGDEAAIDTLGDYCWGQLATNLSMEHATGVVSKLAVAKGTGFEASLLLTDAATAIVQAFGQNFSALVANVVVLDQEVKGALDFPTGPAPNEPFDDDVPCTALAPPADRICDRERFITGSTFGVPVGARVGLRLQQDSLNTMTQFFLNRIHTAHGSSSGVARRSARLLDGDGNSITMLGVPPSHEAMISEGGQKKDPIVPYVDRPVQSYDAFTPVQHMFWRGRIKEICEHTATNWAAVEQLQAACRAGSSNGGNVAACTSCVEIASLHAPLRGLTPEIHPAIDQTACSLVGTYALDYSEGLQRIVGAPAGIPSEWFDLEDGDAAPGEVTYAYDWTPGKVAFHWCTGVEFPRFLGQRFWCESGCWPDEMRF